MCGTPMSVMIFELYDIYSNHSLHKASLAFYMQVSYFNLTDWLQEIERILYPSLDVAIYLVGNKIDEKITRVINPETAKVLEYIQILSLV